MPFVNLIVFPLPERTPEKLSIVYAPVSSILSAFILKYLSEPLSFAKSDAVFMRTGLFSEPSG